jgi:hypothetical protein
MASKASMLRQSRFHKGPHAGMKSRGVYVEDSHDGIKSERYRSSAVGAEPESQNYSGKRGKHKYMTFWMDFDGQNLFDQFIDMSYLSDEFEDANFYLVDADSKYDAARQFVTGKYNDLVRRNKRSEIQNMCLEYIFEELSEGEHLQVEGKIGHLISAIENLMEAYEIDDASSEDIDSLKAFFNKSNVSELFTPEVELELFIQENILNVGVLELKSFAEKNIEI